MYLRNSLFAFVHNPAPIVIHLLEEYILGNTRSIREMFC